MKYIDTDILRKEIEKKYNSNDIVGDKWDLGYDTACEQILDIIDFLQQEPPEIDLEKEYKEYVEDDPVFSVLSNRHAGLVIARHFYELGRKTKEDKK